MKNKVIAVLSVILLLVIALWAQTHIQAVLDVAQTWTANQTFAGGTTIFNLVHVSGSPYTLTGISGYYWNNTSGAFGWVLDTPVAGKQYCVGNYSGRSGALTITSTTSVFIVYQGANGTVTTGTLVSGAALGDFVCLEGVDTTHYMVLGTGNGSWTNN